MLLTMKHVVREGIQVGNMLQDKKGGLSKKICPTIQLSATRAHLFISLPSSNTQPSVPFNWTWQLLCIIRTSDRPAEKIHVIQVSPMRHISSPEHKSSIIQFWKNLVSSHTLLHILYTLPSISAHLIVCIYLLFLSFFFG